MLDLVPPPKLQHPCSAQQATSKSVLFFLGKYCYLSELLQQQLFAVLRCAHRCLQGCKTRKDAEGQKRILRGSLSIKQLWLGKVCITSVAKSFSTSFTLSHYSAWQCHTFTRAQFPGLGVDNRWNIKDYNSGLLGRNTQSHPTMAKNVLLGQCKHILKRIEINLESHIWFAFITQTLLVSKWKAPFPFLHW